MCNIRRMSAPLDLTSHYKLEQVLSWTGVARTFRGVDPVGGEPVAVKLLTLGASSRAADAQRFESGVGILKSLQHPSLPRIVAGGVAPSGDAYLVTGWIEGKSLDDEKEPAVEAVLSAMLRIVEGLESLALHGLVHLNLIPENILLSKDGAKLIGWGPSLVSIDRQASPKSSSDGPIHNFTAPELLQPRSAGEALWRADLYSIALMTARLLGAQIAAPGSPSPSVRFSRDLSDQLGRAEELRGVVQRCLIRDPEQRPGAYSELTRALQHAMPRTARAVSDTQPVDVVSPPASPAGGMEDQTIIMGAGVATAAAAAHAAKVGMDGEAPSTPEEKGSFDATATPAPEASTNPSGARIGDATTAMPVGSLIDQVADVSPVVPAPSGSASEASQAVGDATVMMPTAVDATVRIPTQPAAPEPPNPMDQTVQLSTLPEPDLPKAEPLKVASAEAEPLAAVPPPVPPVPKLAGGGPDAPSAKSTRSGKKSASAATAPKPGPVKTSSPVETMPTAKTAKPPSAPKKAAKAADLPRAAGPPSIEPSSSSAKSDASKPESQPTPVEKAAASKTLAAAAASKPAPAGGTANSGSKIPAPVPESSSTPKIPLAVILAGAAGLVLLMIVSLVAVFFIRGRSTPEEIVETPPPPIQAPVVPAIEDLDLIDLAPELPEALVQTLELIADEKWLEARKTLAALAEEEADGNLDPELCAAFRSVEETLIMARRDQVRAGLEEGLRQANAAGVQRVLRAMDGAEEAAILSRRGGARVLSRSRLLVTSNRGFSQALDDGDAVAALQIALEMKSKDEPLAERLGWLDRALGILDSRVEVLIAAGRLEEAEVVLAQIESAAPGRNGTTARRDRIAQERASDKRYDTLLTSARDAGTRGRPHEGFAMLEGVQVPADRRGEFDGLSAELQRRFTQMDAGAPEIAAPNPEYRRGTPIEIELEVKDDYEVMGVTLFVRQAKGTSYTEIDAQKGSDGRYLVTIEASVHDDRNLRYYVTAVDRSGHEGRVGSGDQPLEIKRKRWFN